MWTLHQVSRARSVLTYRRAVVSISADDPTQKSLGLISLTETLLKVVL